MRRQMMKLVDKYDPGEFTVVLDTSRKYNPFLIYYTTRRGKRSLLNKYADMESAVRFVHDIYVGKIAF